MMTAQGDGLGEGTHGRCAFLAGEGRGRSEAFVAWWPRCRTTRCLKNYTTLTCEGGDRLETIYINRNGHDLMLTSRVRPTCVMIEGL